VEVKEEKDLERVKNTRRKGGKGKERKANDEEKVENACVKGKEENERERNNAGKPEKVGSAREKGKEEKEEEEDGNADGERENGKSQKRKSPEYWVSEIQILSSFSLLPRDAISRICCGPVTICLSVCLSIYLSRVGVLSKTFNKQHRTIAQGIQFSDVVKFQSIYFQLSAICTSVGKNVATFDK